MENTPHALQEIERCLKIEFIDKDLLLLASIHRSYWNENQDVISDCNERLEFLGDSVLGLIVGEYLYVHLPTVPEGVLSEMRSRLVDALACVSYVHKLNLSEFLLLGRGEKMNIGKGRESILADFFEALIGALYLDQGYLAAQNFFLTTFRGDIEKIISEPTHNWKAELQDWSQKKYKEAPNYLVLEESGPAHQKHFIVEVVVKGERLGQGEGNSKKEAQAMAAKDALKNL